MIKGFYKQVQQQPEAPAVYIHNRFFSYKTVWNKAVSLSIQIHSTNAWIALYTENSIETYAGILGIILSGNGLVPLNPKFPISRLSTICKTAKTETIVGSSNNAKYLSKLHPDVTVIQQDKLKQSTENNVSFKHSKDDPAYLLFTSGSTGKPKGIPISHNNFTSFIDSMKDLEFDFDQQDKWLQSFELSFDVSLACTFLCWEYGACLYPIDTSNIVPIESIKAIMEHKLSIATITPSMVAYLEQLKILNEVTLSSLKYTFFTAEALTEDIVTSWRKASDNCSIINAYGPTEASVWSFISIIKNDTHYINNMAPIGKALKNIQFKTGENQEKGELQLGGKQIASFYLNDDKTSKENFYHTDIQWYKTGDIVGKNKDGEFVFLYRKDDQVQINGFRVEPDDIAAAIKHIFPGKRVIVLPQKDTSGINYLVAAIETDKLDLKKTNDHLRELLPAYMIPTKITAIANFPVNNSGKTDRKKIIEIIHEQNKN